MKEEEITNVILVENASLLQVVLKITSRQFMKEKKDYKCNFCAKSFTSLGYAKIHINIVHDGKKNHRCEFCEETFSLANTLRSHIKTIHDCIKDQNCDICGKSFPTKSNLTHHINRLHARKCES